MEDFASSAMFRLIRAGLLAQGVEPPVISPTTGARIPLSAKRNLLAGLVARHGANVLLRIPEVLPSMPQEPALRALTLATDPLDLLARWGRLERFAHSRHRIRWSEPAPGELLLSHRALDSDKPPTPEESLLILALLTKLCEMTGVRGLLAGPEDDEPWRRDGEWRDAPGVAPNPTWRLRYDPGTHEKARNAALLPCEPTSSEELPRRIRDLLAADPCRNWALATLASTLATSPRTLQRSLRRAGSSLTQVSAETRMEAAAELLSRSRLGLAEIGFTCGFADQAHFTRAFKRFSAFTPAAYRSDFSRR